MCMSIEHLAGYNNNLKGLHPMQLPVCCLYVVQ